jgi:hypothetical protein
MSAPEQTDTSLSTPVTEIVAGFLAAAAIFGGVAALVYYPARIGLASIVVALVATGMAGGVSRRLTALGMACAAGGFFFGMVIAVLLDRPVF